jgi:hypothetical protein
MQPVTRTGFLAAAARVPRVPLMRVLVALAILGAVGCGRPDRQLAAGSHYGVGVPRTAWTFGKPPQSGGQTTGMIAAPDQIDYRPKRPHVWPPLATARWPLTWAQYRGSPSNR